MKLNHKHLNQNQQFVLGQLAQELDFEISQGDDAVTVKAHISDDSLSVEFSADANEVKIGYSREAEFSRGLRLFAQSFLPSSPSSFSIHETAQVKELGLMIDCSRNAIMTVSTLKQLIRKLSLLGYTYLQLYTEDTYEVDGEPYFGHFRGRYSKEELREVDGYSAKFGIELIPCIQTLAHLNAITRWEVYKPIIDVNDILFVGEARTYELIENMFKTISETFTSRNINIGMDEAHMLGLGKYLDKHGFTNRSDIMAEHLTKVVEICNRYGFKPMMWSDMFFRLAAHGEYSIKAVITDEVIRKVPKEVALAFWEYWSDDPEFYNEMFAKHKQFNNPILFAGGATKWIGMAPENRFSMYVTPIALKECLKHGIDNVLVTAWGDGGGECSIFSVLPTLAMFAENLYGKELSNETFRMLAKCDLETFLSVDLPNRLSENDDPKELNNSSRYILYDDVFNGIIDTIFEPNDKLSYAGNIKKLEAAAHECKEFSYIFKTLKALTQALEIRIDLGTRTRKAYKDGDLVALAKLAEGDYAQLILKLRELHKIFREQWFKENKPHGFDVQDLRFGAIIMRLESCKERLEAFANGEITSIDELDEAQLDYFGGGTEFKKSRSVYGFGWQQFATVNNLSW